MCQIGTFTTKERKMDCHSRKNEDLKKLIASEKLHGLIKEPNRIITILQCINDLSRMVEKNVKNAIEADSELTVKDYFKFLSSITMSKNLEYSVLKKMPKKVKVFEELKMTFAVVVKLRKEPSYQELLVEEYRKSDVIIPHKIWLKAMTSDDPWYIFQSYKIKILILEKCLETACSADEIINVCECKKSFYMNGDLFTLLKEMNLNKDWWREIKEKSTIKEIKEIASKKLKT